MNPGGLDVQAVEEDLRRVPGVHGVRVVTNGEGEIIEVHVLSDQARAPKQVVRDLQAVVKVSYDLDLDHRVVSVAQLGDEQLASVAPGGVEPAGSSGVFPRVLVKGIGVARDGLRYSVEVALERDGERYLGSAEGSTASAVLPTTAARAALAALAHLLPPSVHLDLEAVTIERLGVRRFAAVSLALLSPPLEELLLGCAPVRAAGDEDAVARAVLDAINRRVALEA
jgi:hypothetical protein